MAPLDDGDRNDNIDLIVAQTIDDRTDKSSASSTIIIITCACNQQRDVEDLRLGVAVSDLVVRAY